MSILKLLKEYWFIAVVITSGISQGVLAQYKIGQLEKKVESLKELQTSQAVTTSQLQSMDRSNDRRFNELKLSLDNIYKLILTNQKR